jgi:hypothetical protein
MIRVLFLAANPAGMTQLALDDEVRAIDAKIRAAEHRDRLELTTRWAVRLDDLSVLQMWRRPDVVHFSGHGAPSGEILLLDADGSARPVSPNALAGFFRVLKDNVRVVVLNACYSEAQAQAIVKEIDCAVGMSSAIGDDHAIAFASEFYQALAYGRSVQDAFDLGGVRLIGEGVADVKGLVKLHKRRGFNPSGAVLDLAQSESKPQPKGEPTHQGGTGRTNHESQFRRLIPANKPPGDKSDDPWVIVLSDWSQRTRQELIDQIERIFQQPDEQAPVPTVLIVDDLGSLHADHELLLNDLTNTGGILLASDSQEEIETIRRDPLAFAATQLAAVQAPSVVTTAPLSSVPSSPDAYKEFAKAVTRLSPGALQDVIEGNRPDDWRYLI